MALEINEIEKRLQSLIQVYVSKYLPAHVYEERIAQRLAETLRVYVAAQAASSEAELPHEFVLVVHPSTLTRWNHDERLLAGLKKILELVVDELGTNFQIAPTITFNTDPLIGVDDLQVRLLRDANLAETQDLKGGDAVDESAPLKPAFLIVSGTKVFPIRSAVTNIGRRADNHVIIDDPRISRYHAQVRYVRGRFIIFDLDSTGGMYVNGQRVNQSVLYAGDVISLAGLPIIFGQDNPPPNISTGDTSPLTPATTDRRTAVLKTIPPDPKPKT